MITAQQNQRKTCRCLTGRFANDGDGLDHLRDWHFEQTGHVLAFDLARRCDFFHRHRGASTRSGRRQRFCQFNVGRVIRVRAVGQRIFAGVGQHVEFMRTGAANRTGIRRNRAEFQTKPRKNARVGFVHVLVLALQIGKAGVERVTILHQKFPPAHDAEARANFVAELHLHLIKMQWQLAIAFDFLAHDIGNHFFMRRADHEIALMPILEAQQLGAVLFPTPRFLP